MACSGSDTGAVQPDGRNLPAVHPDPHRTLCHLVVSGTDTAEAEYAGACTVAIREHRNIAYNRGAGILLTITGTLIHAACVHLLQSQR